MRWWTAFIVGRKHEKAIKAGIASTLLVGDGLLQVHVAKRTGKAMAEGLVYGDIQPEYFMFNNPESACRTCGGLGVHKLTHPELLVPDPRRSIIGGCFVKEAYKYNPDTWDGRVMYSLSQTLRFSLDTPWEKLPEAVRERHPQRGGEENRNARTRPRLKVKRDEKDAKEARRSASAGSPGGSNGITGATGSVAKPVPEWKRGSTR